jgi:hypothetical protein
MNSRLLQALDEKIAGSTGPAKNHLRADRAAYLARAGRIEEAWEEILSIRRNHSAFDDSRLSALLNFAEGLFHYYKDVSPTAGDRFARARALAQIGGHTDVAGRAISWLGLTYYGSYRFNDVCHCIDECIVGIGCTDSTALARTSLTIAIATHLANRFDLAMPWYRRTHLFAVETNDEAMISAMLHNMASLWLSNCRNSQLGGPTTADRSRQALMGALSSFNFDGLVGLSALEVLTPLLEAQICSLEADHDRAADLYDRCHTDFDVQSIHNWGTWMLADREWCRLRAGKTDGAVSTLDSVHESLRKMQHVDEQAATLARLADSWRMLGEEERARHSEVAAQHYWREFSELQMRILDSVLSTKGTLSLSQDYPI